MEGQQLDHYTMALMDTEFSMDRLSLIDDNGNLLVLTVRDKGTVYELHNTPYKGPGEVYDEWFLYAKTMESIGYFCNVCNGEGDGSSVLEPILVGNGKPVRVVTKLNKEGPVYKTMEYHHIEAKGDAIKFTPGGYTLHYSNEHPATKDCYADDTARQLAYQDVKTSTGLVVEAALCYIMEGVLKDVSITVEGRLMTINPDHGYVTDCARFPSRDYSKRLMLAMISKYKKPV